MKNKKMKLLICMLTFIFLLYIASVVVNATYIDESEIYISNIDSDTSGAASPINKVMPYVIRIYKWGAFIGGCIILVNGIKVLLNKKPKRGIIYIVVALFLLFTAIMADAIVIHDHNIEV